MSQDDVCHDHKCRRGSICVVNHSTKDGYSCRCKIGTKGKYCEQSVGTIQSSNPITGKYFHIWMIF